MNKFSNLEKVAVLVVILVVMALSVFYGTRKISYHCDEIWTYGLANNQGGINPSFETGVEYQGMGPFESFTQVLDGEAFTYANVWENQAKDVHPPFYYLLIHTVCSIFKGSFSKWYGIAVNLCWMILIVIVLFKLSKEVTENSLLAFGITLSYGCSVLFLDTLLLIRMYTQFTFFVIALSYLLKRYWDKELDRRFYIEISLIAIFGMLSHYYFLMFIFAMCIIFAIRLIRKKSFAELKKYIITLVVSGLIYGVVWYHILAHIFNGYRGEEAISKALSFGGLFSGFAGLVGILNSELFAGLIIVFVVLAVVFFALGIKNKSVAVSFELCLFCSAVFYMLVVGKIAPKITSRYVMPMGWIFILLSFVVVSKLLAGLSGKLKTDYAVIAVFLLINVFNLVSRGGYIPMDYYDASFVNALDKAAGKDAVVYVDLKWKILYDFEILNKVDKYVFADEDNFEELTCAQNKDYVLIVNLNEAATDAVQGLNAELMYDDGMNYYYLVSAN